MHYDKFGRDYDQLLGQQAAELEQWKQVLKPDVYEALAYWCDMTNGPAEPISARGPYRAGGLHSVPVAQELHHFLMKFGRKGKPIVGIVPKWRADQIKKQEEQSLL